MNIRGIRQQGSKIHLFFFLSFEHNRIYSTLTFICVVGTGGRRNISAKTSDDCAKSRRGTHNSFVLDLDVDCTQSTDHWRQKSSHKLYLWPWIRDLNLNAMIIVSENSKRSLISRFQNPSIMQVCFHNKLCLSVSLSFVFHTFTHIDSKSCTISSSSEMQQPEQALP